MENAFPPHVFFRHMFFGGFELFFSPPRPTSHGFLVLLNPFYMDFGGFSGVFDPATPVSCFLVVLIGFQPPSAPVTWFLVVFSPPRPLSHSFWSS